MAEVDLVVHQFGGGEYRFKVNLDRTSVGDVKVLLFPVTNLPVDDQILAYNGKTLSDTQTLKEAGVHGSLYKMILGSKSFDPMGRPEDAPPVKLINSYGCGVQSRMENEFKDYFTHEEIRKLSATMWHKLKAMSMAISYDHLEKVSAAAMEVHNDALRMHKENYLKTFMDSRWENLESEKIMKARRAVKKKAWLAEEATPSASGTGEPSGDTGKP